MNYQEIKNQALSFIFKSEREGISPSPEELIIIKQYNEMKLGHWGYDETYVYSQQIADDIFWEGVAMISI